jgi:hypothetical protein
MYTIHFVNSFIYNYDNALIYKLFSRMAKHQLQF